MSRSDDQFYMGQVHANRQRNAQVNEERQTTYEWIAHAKRLEAERDSLKNVVEKMNANAVVASEEVLRWQVHGNASMEMVRELRKRLEVAAPSDPMGRSEVVTPLLRKRKREMIEAMGYRVVEEEGFLIAPK